MAKLKTCIKFHSLVKTIKDFGHKPARRRDKSNKEEAIRVTRPWKTESGWVSITKRSSRPRKANPQPGTLRWRILGRQSQLLLEMEQQQVVEKEEEVQTRKILLNLFEKHFDSQTHLLLHDTRQPALPTSAEDWRGRNKSNLEAHLLVSPLYQKQFPISFLVLNYFLQPLSGTLTTLMSLRFITWLYYHQLPLNLCRNTFK